MIDPRIDPPLHLDTSRSIWIGWGAELFSIWLSYLIGGNFFPYLCLFLAIVMIVRGCKPTIFANHIDAQIIAGTPYRREESLKAWGVATAVILTLAGFFTWIHPKIAPGTPDIALVVRDAVKKALEEETRKPPIIISSPATPPKNQENPLSPIPKHSGSLILNLTPYVVVERIFVKSDNREIQGFAHYTFSLVLHVLNNYKTPRNIRQIHISGEAPIDFGEYIASRAADGDLMSDLESEFLRRRPYYSLSLVAYPKAGGRVEGDGTERFIQFDISKPSSYGARMFNERSQDYVGYKDPTTPPKKPTTEPNIKDFILFKRKDPRNFQEWQGPKLRKEITDGAVEFTVVADTAAIKMTPNNINPAQLVLKKNWLEDNPADLYFQGKYGYPIDRKAVPGHDPAVPR
jgi:hypothetical protein